jgi:uncharacterized protein YggU (UPF0235/DUF167 family)
MKTAINRRDAERLRLSLRVTPNGGRDALDGCVRDAKGAMLIKARVGAPPERGKANAALVALLASEFGVHKSAVTILRGAAARIKQVQICGEGAKLAACLKKIGGAA